MGCHVCPDCGGCHCEDCNEWCPEAGPYSVTPETVEPGDPTQLVLSTLPDGSPLLRIGGQIAIGLDVDHLLAALPDAAIGEVRTERGHHLLCLPDADLAALKPLADPGHFAASLVSGCWDLRLLDKETGTPRCLRPVNQALQPGPAAELFAAVAKVWREGGGAVAAKTTDRAAGAITAAEVPRPRATPTLTATDPETPSGCEATVTYDGVVLRCSDAAPSALRAINEALRQVRPTKPDLGSTTMAPEDRRLFLVQELGRALLSPTAALQGMARLLRTTAGMAYDREDVQGWSAALADHRTAALIDSLSELLEGKAISPILPLPAAADDDYELPPCYDDQEHDWQPVEVAGRLSTKQRACRRCELHVAEPSRSERLLQRFAAAWATGADLPPTGDIAPPPGALDPATLRWCGEILSTALDLETLRGMYTAPAPSRAHSGAAQGPAAAAAPPVATAAPAPGTLFQVGEYHFRPPGGVMLEGGAAEREAVLYARRALHTLVHEMEDAWRSGDRTMRQAWGQQLWHLLELLVILTRACPFCGRDRHDGPCDNGSRGAKPADSPAGDPTGGAISAAPRQQRVSPREVWRAPTLVNWCLFDGSSHDKAEAELDAAFTRTCAWLREQIQAGRNHRDALDEAFDDHLGPVMLAHIKTGAMDTEPCANVRLALAEIASQVQVNAGAGPKHRPAAQGLAAIADEGDGPPPPRSNAVAAGLLAKVERVARLRERQADRTSTIQRRPGPACAGGEMLVVEYTDFFGSHQALIAALPQPPQHGDLQALAAWVRSDLLPFEYASLLVVHLGSAVPPEVRREMRDWRVLTQTMDEYETVLDFRPYLAQQAERLGAEPALYQPQRLWYSRGLGPLYVNPPSDALTTMQGWMLDAAHPRRVFVLGERGAGKTLLLQQLARRLAQGRVVPVLVDMSAYEKAPSLDMLLAVYLRTVPRLDLAAVQFLLEEGRLALLFDGFDALAERVGEEIALAHLGAVAEAAALGNAKVVFASRTSRVIHEALLSPEPQLVGLVRPAFLATVFAPDQPEGHGVESQGEIVRELRRIASEDDPGLMTKEETR